MQQLVQKFNFYKFDIQGNSAYNTLSVANPKIFQANPNLNRLSKSLFRRCRDKRRSIMPLKSKTKKRLECMSRNLVALVLMMTICVASVITVMAKTVEVTIVDNGEETSISIMDANQENVLETAVRYQRIQPVGEEDSVVFDSETNQLTIRRGIDVTVTADGETRKVDLYYGDTVAEAVEKAGFVYGENDVLSLDADKALEKDAEVTITRYYHVSVTADGKTQELLVKEGDVQSALDAASITLGKEDMADVKLDTALSEGLAIKVARVTYEEETKKESVDYAVKQVKTDSLYEGETKVQTKGVEGERTIVYRNKLVDGKVVETEEISNEVTKKPVDKVELVGTKERPSAAYASISADGTLIDHNGNKVSYVKSFTGRCTAYTGGGWTATGRPAQYGNIAVDPDVIPYGSKLYICSPDGSIVYGYATAADTGGFASMGYIMADLYFDTYQECANFGVRNMTIYVLS